ncbi:MAG: type II toxin-antitoxin system HicB family antitoxin [Vicinamibacteria bacterium]|jgi:predicted RNase H-like HicB family nuclease|nr:type II toxin-antitoxin system HicB family antitoxin [Vicinamibacteria bacterium]
MLSEYFDAAMRNAVYELLSEERLFYAEIPGFEGVYASHANLEGCRGELREVLEEWVLLRVSRQLPLPVVDGRELTIKAVAY